MALALALALALPLALVRACLFEGAEQRWWWRRLIGDHKVRVGVPREEEPNGVHGFSGTLTP